MANPWATSTGPWLGIEIAEINPTTTCTPTTSQTRNRNTSTRSTERNASDARRREIVSPACWSRPLQRRLTSVPSPGREVMSTVPPTPALSPRP